MHMHSCKRRDTDTSQIPVNRRQQEAAVLSNNK